MKPPNPSPGHAVSRIFLALTALAATVMLSACARQAETKPRAQTKPPLEFLGEWGTKGPGPDQLQEPISLTTDFAGSVYVADAGNGFIHKFSVSGEPLLAFNDPLIPTPSAIAVDSGGALYVSDQDHHRVFVFWPTGDRLREQRRGGGARFRNVAGMAVDGDGNLYVADAGANQVLKYDAEGRLRKVWGKKGSKPGEFHSPLNIAVGPDGFVYVVDLENARIEKFTRDGVFISSWGGQGSGSELKTPMAIAFGEKFAVVTDGDSLIRVMTLDGTIRHTEDISSRVKFNPHFPDLTAISLIGKDELVVLDSAGAKVLRFRINM